MPHRPVRLFDHVHFYQRDRPVQHRFQRRRHAIAVQRKAPDDHIRVPVQVKDRVLVVRDHAMAVPAPPAAKAAPARRDLLFPHVNDMDFVPTAPVHAFQKGIGQTESIALHLGAAVQNKDLHQDLLSFVSFAIQASAQSK